MYINEGAALIVAEEQVIASQVIRLAFLLHQFVFLFIIIIIIIIIVIVVVVIIAVTVIFVFNSQQFSWVSTSTGR